MNRAEPALPPIERLTPAELLSEFNVNIAAPMVRYSKQAFRHLVSEYNVHITHTPMMIAREFSRSARARQADFTTSHEERGVFHLHEDGSLVSESLAHGRTPSRRIRGCLIAQFAANDSELLATAAELISPYVDAIDLNCGCPQKWAYKEEIGSWLLRNPQIVSNMVKTVKSRVTIPVHIKIRVDSDLQNTKQLIETAIEAGVDVISVHGRTRHQSSAAHPVSLKDIAFANEIARGRLPIVANGDVFNLADAKATRATCGVRGVMSARGLLENPALFAGYELTPNDTVKRFVNLSIESGLIFPLFHRHCFFMMENSMGRKSERIMFNALGSHASVLNALHERNVL